MLGHGGVLVPALGGGRTLLDRQVLVAWGDPPVARRSAAEPWPGRLPHPLPGTVFETRHPVQVVDARGETVLALDRGGLTASPAAILAGAKRLAITAWAGPWPIDERWWSADARRAWRVQAVDDVGCGWLLVLEGGAWWAEARYD
jgi:protein ImuB